MNEKVEQLRRLKHDIDSVITQNPDALRREPEIAVPLHEAAEEAARRLDRVSESEKPSDPISDIEHGIHEFIAGTCGVIRSVADRLRKI